MGYRVKTWRALKRIAPQGLSAVQSAIRARDDGVALAMSFDPGTVSDIALNSHAIDILMGLLYVRGWAQAQQDMLIAMAQDWTDRWWERTLGPGAFVVETALRPDARCEVDDITRIASLAALAWCMELDVCERERPTPDLMLAAAVPELHQVHTHWKRQPYGQEGKKRKIILVQEYERGPKPRDDQIVMQRLPEPRTSPE